MENLMPILWIVIVICVLKFINYILQSWKKFERSKIDKEIKNQLADEFIKAKKAFDYAEKLKQETIQLARECVFR